MAKTRIDPRQPDFFLDVPFTGRPVPKRTPDAPPPSTCDLHGLWAVWADTASSDGRYTYLVCGCGLRLRTTPEVWQEERTRRAAQQQGLDELNARVSGAG